MALLRWGSAVTFPWTIYDACIGNDRTEEPVVVSWWAGPAYQPHIDRLRASLVGRSVEWLILTSPLDLGGWEANCNRKPRAIQFARWLLRRPIVWLDADAEVVTPCLNIEKLLPPGIDAALMMPPLQHPGRWPLVNSTLMSGTMGFGYTAAADFLIRRWADLCEMDYHGYDQETLARTLTEPVFRGLVVKSLDPRLICVPDLMPDVKDPIVIHHQASRSAECRYQ